MDYLKLYSRSERVLGSLIQTVRIFSKDIGMQFGTDNCAMLVMKKSNFSKLLNEKVINWLEKEGVSYKYLGVLQADEVMSIK